MIEAFWNGIIGGLLLAVLIGPVFFALIQTSINKGFFHGVFLAIGIVVSDGLYFFLCFIGVNSIDTGGELKTYLGLIGGLILVVFGIANFFKPIPTKGAPQRDLDSTTTMVKEVVKGFLLNGINPGVLIFWFGIVSSVSTHERYGNPEGMAVFALGILLTVFTTDILKAYLANKLSTIITPQFMGYMNRTVGVLLCVFGLVMFFRSFASGIWNLESLLP